jgi:alditol oxidase
MTTTAGPRTNWAGNIAFGAPDLYLPASLGELQTVVARARQIRVLGTGHSFNDMADSPGAQVSLAGLPPEVEVDSAASLVRVAAGLSYASLATQLDRQRFALCNLASLPHISVAGACATGTHGSGPANQNLSAAVTGLELVTADGDVVELSRGEESFPGAVVHLGALGVITRLILEVVPSFEVSQRVYEDLPLDVLDDHFAAIMASGYSVSMFTDWHAPRLTQLWVKSLAEDGTPAIEGEPWFTATPAPAARNPVPGLPADNSTGQLGVPGPWFERLPHFRPEFTPSAGDELQTEYLLPAEHAVPAVHALHQVGEGIAPVLRICEIRAIAGDDLWLSPYVPARQRGLPLHLDPRHRRGAARGHADRAAAGPVRPPPALGEDLHHPHRGALRELRPPPRLPRPGPALRPRGQVPQRLHRALPGPLAASGEPGVLPVGLAQAP